MPYKLYSIQTRLPCNFHKGYIRVKHPETGEWVYEHRFVYQKAHGTIPDGCHIDHIFEDKTDNRLDKLQCLSHGDHMRKHKIGNNYGKATRKFTDTHAHCGCCKKILPNCSFGKCKSSPSGLYPYCKQCRKEKHLAKSQTARNQKFL